jgi:hypothetical protein
LVVGGAHGLGVERAHNRGVKGRAVGELKNAHPNRSISSDLGLIILEVLHHLVNKGGKEESQYELSFACAAAAVLPIVTTSLTQAQSVGCDHTTRANRCLAYLTVSGRQLGGMREAKGGPSPLDGFFDDHNLGANQPQTRRRALGFGGISGDPSDERKLVCTHGFAARKHL